MARLADSTGDQMLVEGQAPLTVYCMPHINLLPGDTTGPGSVTSVEVDPGDGSGWFDITDKWRNFMAAAATGSVTVTSDYTEIEYTMQGLYEMQARVEFTDGEIYSTDAYTGNVLQPGIQVLPYAETTFVEFTDPRDGSVYDIIDGRLIIAFVETLDRETADQFCADMGLEIINEWWEVQGLGVVLPARYSVLEAVRDWPGLYPDIIDTVDPDEVFDWD